MALTTNQLVVGMFNMAAGGYKTLVGDYMTAHGATATADTLLAASGLNPQFMGTNLLSNTDFASGLIGRVLSGVSSSIQSSLTTIVSNYMTANPTLSRGAVVVAVIEAVLAVPTTDATLGTAVSSFTSKVALADASTSTSTDFTTLAAVIGAPVTTTGQAFTLTTAVDTIAGTSGNDTIASANGRADGAATTASTLSASDTIDGGAGTDTLSIIMEGDFANNTDITLPAATIKNVETVTVRNLMTVDGTGDTITLDGANATGHTMLASDRSTAAVAFTNVADGATIGIIGNEAATGNVTATYKTASNALKLEVSGGTKTSTFTNATVTTATSATITSSGTVANGLGAMDLGSASLLTSVTVDASARFLTTDLGDATDDFAANAALTVRGAAANSSAGVQAVTVGTLDSNIATVDASGLTAGGLSATLTAGVTSLKGGAGNDKITSATLTSTSTQIIDAGAGTGDILAVAASANVATLAKGKGYANFEILEVANGVSVDVENLATYNTITGLRLTTGGTLTNVSATQAGDVTVTTGGNSPTITIKDATVSGNIDTLNLKLDDGSSTTATTIALGTPVLAGVEILGFNVASGDTGTIALLTSATQLTNINLTGAGTASITSDALALQTNFKIDASSGTGTNTVDFTGATTNGFAYVGNAKVDTVTMGVRGDNTISTGAGKDVVNAVAKTGGTGGDIITMGANADTFSFGAQVGNDAFEQTTFKFASTDSVIISSGTNGYSSSTMDDIQSIANDATAATAAGQVFIIDTDKTATAVTSSTTAVTFGTTTVTNAYDFYVYAPATGTVAYVYQDTDGDKIIEDGEFGVQLTGVTDKWTTGEFAMNGTTGNLIVTTAA